MQFVSGVLHGAEMVSTGYGTNKPHGYATTLRSNLKINDDTVVMIHPALAAFTSKAAA